MTNLMQPVIMNTYSSIYFELVSCIKKIQCAVTVRIFTRNCLMN